MAKQLSGQIREVVNLSICSQEVEGKFLGRLEGGRLTESEDDESHFCVFFLPFDPDTGRVFIGHHKKSGLWLSPGGHIDEGELLSDTLRREVREELGVKEFDPSTIGSPFLLTITKIDNPPQVCREHFDIWYLMKTDGSGFNVDGREYHETEWFTLDEAMELAVQPNLGLALKVLKEEPAS